MEEAFRPEFARCAPLNVEGGAGQAADGTTGGVEDSIAVTALCSPVRKTFPQGERSVEQAMF